MATTNHLLTFALVLLVISCMTASGQLTFTPNWGKRQPSESSLNAAAASAAAAGQMVGNSIYGNENNCKSMDAMLVIYRLIMTEAQRILDCTRQK